MCYTNQDDANHLLTALHAHYQVTKDWDATRYCSLTLAWDYDNHTINISMPGYIECALLCFHHLHPKHCEHAPHAW